MRDNVVLKIVFFFNPLVNNVVLTTTNTIIKLLKRLKIKNLKVEL